MLCLSSQSMAAKYSHSVVTLGNALVFITIQRQWPVLLFLALVSRFGEFGHLVLLFGEGQPCPLFPSPSTWPGLFYYSVRPLTFRSEEFIVRWAERFRPTSESNSRPPSISKHLQLFEMLARGFQKYIANLPDHDVEVIPEVLPMFLSLTLTHIGYKIGIDCYCTI